MAASSFRSASENRVCRDRAPASGDVADSLSRYPDVLCEAVLRQAKRLEEFLFQHLARRDRKSLAHGLFLQ